VLGVLASGAAAGEPAEATAAHLSAPGAEAGTGGGGTDGFQLLLVGLWMSGLEVGEAFVYEHEGAYWLSLEDLEDFLNVRVTRDDGFLRAMTPIGSVDLAPDDVRILDGRDHLSPVVLQDRLKTRVDFEPAEYALILRPPWLGVEPPPGEEGAALEPEITAPRNNLSRAYAELTYAGDDTSTWLNGRYLFEGRLAAGRWRLRYTDDLADNRHLQEYAWVRALGTGYLLLGRQRATLHPLLGSFELTGVQYAWSNQALPEVVDDPGADVLIPRGLQPSRTFTGTGPPGGIAELYVNDRFVASQTIQLDGRYEFLDVPLPSQLSARIETRVYDRFDRAAPVAIREQRIGLSQFLLDQGHLVQLGGIGVAGNWIDGVLFNDTSSVSEPDQPAGFYQLRYGISPRLTAEALVQQTDERTQVLAGLVAQVTDAMTASLAAATSGGVPGYDLGLGVQGERWRLSLSSRFRQQGFFSTDTTPTYDHALDFDVAVHRTLDLSLIARHWRTSTDQASFVLPAVAWRPAGRFYLLARPDYDGEYRVDSSYQVTRRTRLSARYQDGPAVELEHRLSSQLQARLSGYRPDDRDTAVAATLSWTGSGDRRPRLRGGLVAEGGRLGYVLGGSIEPVPGVYLAVDTSSVPLYDEYGQEDDFGLTFRATLSIDFGFARGRPVPMSRAPFSGAFGGIGGRILVEEAGEAGSKVDLDGVEIAVAGGPSGYATAGGTYSIGSVRPGVHRVSLQSEALPIELVPVDKSMLVEVAAGSVTRVDFHVRAEYGIAGRVRDASGANLTGRRVELMDAGGKRVEAGTTDQFGLYRLDGVPPGDYRLVLLPSPDDPAGTAERRVRVVDDFLFDQDLTLSRRSRGGAD